MESKLRAAVQDRLSDLAWDIQRDRWERLAQTHYHPDATAPTILCEYWPEVAEVLRSGHRTGHAGFTDRESRFRVLHLQFEQERVVLELEETYDFGWPDGCRYVLLRRVEHHWALWRGRWRLSQMLPVVGSEREHLQAALCPPLIPWPSPPLILACMNRWLPSPIAPGLVARLGGPGTVFSLDQWDVALESEVLPRYAHAVLLRVVLAAIDHWNTTLDGLLQLRLHDPSLGAPPHIVIRTCSVAGDETADGFACPARLLRATYTTAQSCHIEVSLVERATPEFLCREPLDMFSLICHELGHALGLGDCMHAGEVMERHARAGYPALAPFHNERQAVARWVQYYDDVAAAVTGRDCVPAPLTPSGGAALDETGARAGPAQRLRAELLHDLPTIPPHTWHYWEGIERARSGDLAGARSSFSCSLALAPTPQVLLRRGSAGDDQECVGADYEAAATLDPDWQRAQEWWAHWLVGRGRQAEAVPVAAAVARMQSAAAWHELRWWVRAGRRPWVWIWLAGRGVIWGGRTLWRVVRPMRGNV